MIVRMRRKGVVVGEGNARLISVFDHQTILRSLVSMNIRRKIMFVCFFFIQLMKKSNSGIYRSVTFRTT